MQLKLNHYPLKTATTTRYFMYALRQSQKNYNRRTIDKGKRINVHRYQKKYQATKEDNKRGAKEQ